MARDRVRRRRGGGASAGRPGRRIGFRPTAEGLEDRRLLTTVPPGFSVSVVAAGLTRPSAMDFAPDGRLFVAEQIGQVRVIQDGHLLPTPFVTLNVDSNWERGLVGITFDPNFETNHYVYVYYTVPGNGTTPAHNRVSRFTADGNVAVPGSEVPILDLPALGEPAHNGGALHFGLDGKLYIGVGDNHVPSNSQSLATPFGKILRINSDGTIPADNPFYNVTTGINRAIWALGLRNPFTFAVQPSTGRIFINDVGEDAWEEIDAGRPGANYGWPVTEGPTTDPRFQSPFYAYPHGPNESNGTAITGGSFYDPAHPSFPSDMLGQYFFADFGDRWIKRLDPTSGQVADFASDLPTAVSDVRIDSDGSLYFTSMGISTGDAAIYEIQAPPHTLPAVTSSPADQSVHLGGTATFSASATGSPAPTYQWLKNGAPIPGATSPTLSIGPVGPSDAGAEYQVRVSNPFGSALSGQATIRLLPDPAPPAPPVGTSFARALAIDVLHATPDPNNVSAASVILADGVSPTALATYYLLMPQARSQAVAATYLRVLGRVPSPQELAGATGALYAAQTPDDLAASLYASREYYASHGGNGRSFVVSLYRDLLGRDPSRRELSASRRASNLTFRAGLALQLLGSDQAHASEVAGWYLGYLRRPPSPFESAAWVQAMRAGVSSLQVQAGILGGPEYVADAPIIVAVAGGLGIRGGLAGS